MNFIDVHNYEAFLLDYSEGTLDATVIEQLKAFIAAHPELEIDLSDFDLPHLRGENHSFDLKNSLKKTESEVPDEELLNYLENKLSFEQRISFEFKLAADTDLEKDLEDYKKTILIADPKQVFESKKDLQKTEDDFILNNGLISYLENQLPLAEKIEFEKELVINVELQKEFQLISKTILTKDESIFHPDKEALKKENKVIALYNLRTIGSMAAAILLLLGFALIYNFYITKSVVNGNLAIKNKIELKSFPNGNNPIEKITIKKDTLGKVVQKISFDKTLANKIVKKQIIKEVQRETIHPMPEENSPEIVKDPVKEQEQKTIPFDEQKTEITLNKEPRNFIDTILSQQNYLLVTEEVDDEESHSEKRSNPKGFWKRAVQLAKQANKLGVKSIDGQENSKNKYRLSFNSFSVEKK